MGWEQDEYISRTDLGVAYRKAKADLYYERTSASRLIPMLSW